MSSPRFSTSEEGGVQLPAIMTLARLGWRYVSRAEGEAQRRGRLEQVILEAVLADRMVAINRIHQRGKTHAVPDEAARELIEKLKEAASDRAIGLMPANERVTNLLKLGESVDVEVDGEKRGRQLKFIDWDTPENNLFHMTAEFPVRRERREDTRRPDIVLFVNGIPLVVIEVKCSAIETQQGISQQLRNQAPDEIPRLFTVSQMLIAANDSDPRYATSGTPSKFWSLWREEEIADSKVERIVNAGLDADEASKIWIDFDRHRRTHDGLMDPGAGGRLPNQLDRLLISLCRPDRLLDIVRGYTLFDNGVKKVARYQQYFGVRRSLERVRQHDDDGHRKGGVIWHTQGSGKSLTMVMLAGAIEREFGKARFVLVTDRVDLDRQLTQTFRNAGKQPQQATRGSDLIRMLKDKRPVITTLIHKFKAGLASAGSFTDPDTDIFVLVDESHRSQTVKDIDSLHRQMRKVLPGAAYIGFTGTPLLKREKSTFDRFGGLIHDYKIDQAVADKAVVPLLYEGRHVEMEAQQANLDKWFERKTRNLTDGQKADLKKRIARAQVVQGVEPWLNEVAQDVSEDFERTMLGTPYKAQLVAPFKREAVLLHKMLEEIGIVESAVIISKSDDREGHEDVGDDDDDIVQSFIKKVEAKQPLAKYEEDTIRAFKNGVGVDVLIVVDKLLTGFDAPRNQTLYIAKNLRDHKLLQAIARVNRLFSSEEKDEDGDALYDKEHGRIVDYVGILEDLDQALTAYSAFEGYDEGDVAQALVSIREEVDTLPDKHAALLDLFKGVGNHYDPEAYALHLRDELRRKRFYDRLSDFARALQTAFGSDQFVENTEPRVIANYKQDLKRFEALRRAVRLRYGDAEEDYDYKRYQVSIRALLDKHIDATELVAIVPPVDIFDEDNFKRTVEEQTGTAASVADAITSATQRSITERMDEDPAMYRRFAKMVQDIIDGFREGRLSEKDYLTKAHEIRDQVVEGSRAKTEETPPSLRGDPLGSAIYGQARDAVEKLAGEQSTEISEEIAVEFASIIERQKRVGWTTDPNAENAMRQDMDDYLFDHIKGTRGLYGLSVETMDSLMDAAIAIAKRQAAR